MRPVAFISCGRLKHLDSAARHAGTGTPCGARRVPGADIWLKRHRPSAKVAPVTSATPARNESQSGLSGTGADRVQDPVPNGLPELDLFSDLPTDPYQAYPDPSNNLDSFFNDDQPEEFVQDGDDTLAEEVDDFFSNADNSLDDDYEELPVDNRVVAVEDDFFSGGSAAAAGNRERERGGDALAAQASTSGPNEWEAFGAKDWEASAVYDQEVSGSGREVWSDYQYQAGASPRGAGQYEDNWVDERPARRSAAPGNQQPGTGTGQVWPNTANNEVIYRAPGRQQNAPPASIPTDPFRVPGTSTGFAGSCFDMVELRTLVEQTQDTITPQQVVDVLLHSIVLESRGVNARERQQLMAAAQQFAVDVSPLVAANMTGFDGDQLLKVLQTLTYLGYPDIHLLQALLDAAAVAAPTFTPQQLHDLLWVVASSDVIPPSHEFLAYLADLCHQQLPAFLHDQAASLLQCLVACGFVPSSGWLQDYMEAVQTQLRLIHPLQSLHMLSALAFTGEPPSPSFLTALEVAIVGWDMVALGHAGQMRLLQTLSRWSHRPNTPTMAVIVGGTLAGPIPPRGMEAMVLTNMQLHLGAEPSVRHMSDMATLLVSEIQSGGSAADAAQMVMSLASWTQRLPSCGQSVQRSCRMLPLALSPYPPAVLAQECALLYPEGTTTPAKQLVKLFGALALLSVELPPVWVEDAANALAGWRFEGLDAADISSLLPVLTSYRYQPSVPWMDIFLPTAADRLPLAQPQQLASSLQSLARLNVPLPDEWWHTFSTSLNKTQVLKLCSFEMLAEMCWSIGVLWSQNHDVLIPALPGSKPRGKAAVTPQNMLSSLIYDAALNHVDALDEVALSRLSLGLQFLSAEYANKWLQRFDVFVQGREEVVVRLVV